jgi:hypothetical protein
MRPSAGDKMINPDHFANALWIVLITCAWWVVWRARKKR